MLALSLVFALSYHQPIRNGDEALRAAERYMELLGHEPPFRVQRLSPPYPPDDPSQPWSVRMSDRSGFRLNLDFVPSTGKLRWTDFAPESGYTPKVQGPPLSEAELKERCSRLAAFLSGWLDFESRFSKKNPIGYSVHIAPLVWGLPFLKGGPAIEVWVTKDGKIVHYEGNRGDPQVNASKPRLSEADAKAIADELLREVKEPSQEQLERQRQLFPTGFAYSDSGAPQLGYWQGDRQTIARLVWRIGYMVTLNSASNSSKWYRYELVYFIDALTGRRLPN